MLGRDSFCSKARACYRRMMIALALGVGLLLILPSPARTQPGNDNAAQAPSFGRRIRLTLPIRDSADRVVKRMVQQILDEQPVGVERPVIVFEFWSPDGNDVSGSEFERSLSLARFLTSSNLERVRTVAYIPERATGHAVLVALACEEIIMGEDAILGEAGINETNVAPTVRGAYTEISRRRRTVPEAIALGMLDAELQISRVTTASGDLFAWPEELQRIRDNRADIQEIETLIPAGKMGRFRGDELRELGIASYLADDHDALASVLKIPADQLDFDPSMGGQWKAIQVELSGPINGGSVDRIIKTISRARDSATAANFVCVRIDSPGGSPADSVRLGGFLADLDPSQVRTVAYIPREARGDAMVVAAACDQIVAHPDARLGGSGAASIREQDVEDLRKAIEKIAQQKSRSWSVVAAMIDPGLDVYRFSRAGTDESVFLSTAEFEGRFDDTVAVADPDNNANDPLRQGRWVRGAPITQEGRVLEVDGRQAEQYGLVRYLVDEFAEFRQLYQLDDDPELIGPNWAFELIDALASPELASILLFVGAFALIAELSSPGIGLGGFLSAVCFMLYFWANFLNGTAEVLEILLFLAGVTFIIVEIFVIPGFGVFGLGGGALILLSLVLAVQTFVVPTNEYQYQQFSKSMLMLGAAGMGVFVGMVVLRKYLAHTPFLGRVMLMPPADDEREELSRRESLVDYEHLFDQVGRARTQLTPSGKAMFDDELVDVISDGQLIPKGAEVRVIEVIGSRVVVEPVDPV